MMMQLLFANIGHFVLNVFAMFVFFICGWLYIDACDLKKENWRPIIRGVGFFLMALIAVIHATGIYLSSWEKIFVCIKIFGIYLILISLFLDPMMKKPKVFGGVVLAIPMMVMTILSSIFYLSVGLVYKIKSSVGYERQLKRAGVGFIFLGLSEIVTIAYFWSGTSNVYWAKMLAEYQPIWLLQHGLELGGVVILFSWVWSYLNFRHHLQLFINAMATILSMFLLTTLFFCFLLLKNLEANALEDLRVNANVLQFSIENLQKQALANAKALSGNDSFREIFVKGNKEKLQQMSMDFALLQNIDSIIVATKSGEIVATTEKTENNSNIISNDSRIKGTIEGRQFTSVSVDGSVDFPRVKINASVPIYDDNEKVVGSLIVGVEVDEAFVDGVKKATGLDITVFGNNIRSATTFTDTDGVTRSVGTKETNKSIIDKVLGKGEVYVGPSKVLNQPYYSAYIPMIGVDNKAVGMLYVGKIQTDLIKTARKSIVLTFLGSAGLMLLSIIPTYALSKYIKDQMEA